MDPNSEEMIDAMASAVALIIRRDERAGIFLAFDRLAKAAGEVATFPLSADVEIASFVIP